MFTARQPFMPLALLAAVAITCAGGAAFAGTVPMESTHRTAQVSTTDLNLGNPADVARLDARLKHAAGKVCAPADFRDLRAMSDRPACERMAIEKATPARDMLVARAQSEQLAARTPSAPAAE